MNAELDEMPFIDFLYKNYNLFIFINGLSHEKIFLINGTNYLFRKNTYNSYGTAEPNFSFGRFCLLNNFEVPYEPYLRIPDSVSDVIKNNIGIRANFLINSDLETTLSELPEKVQELICFNLLYFKKHVLY